jgi:hypothetical protein
MSAISKAMERSSDLLRLRAESIKAERDRSLARHFDDPTRRVDTQRTDERFIDRREHRFHASELSAPFLAERRSSR